MISNLNFGSTVNMATKPADLPSGTPPHSPSKSSFSIYSRDIRFEKDYTSNYSFENTKFFKISPNSPICRKRHNDQEPQQKMENSSTVMFPVKTIHEFAKKNNNNESKQFNHNLSNNELLKKTTLQPFVDELHNYSKPCFEENLPYNHTYELHEEDDDEDDDENEEEEINKSNLKNIYHEVKDNSEPDHHARRPMNAFLIFCKRHRTIVREKYPNLENR